MNIDHVIKLCQELNVPSDHLDYVHNEPQFESYLFPVILSPHDTEKKIKREINSMIIPCYPKECNLYLKRRLIVFGIEFKKPVDIHLYQHMPQQKQYVALSKKIVVQKSETILHFIITTVATFEIDFSIRVICSETNPMIVELYIDRYVISDRFIHINSYADIINN